MLPSDDRSLQADFLDTRRPNASASNTGGRDLGALGSRSPFCGAPLREGSPLVFLIGWYLLASIDCFPRLAMRWRSSSRIRSSVGIARVSERIGAGSRDVVVADQLYPRTYASLSTR